MISVIVPVYNCEEYLKNSIESLINQTIFNQLEIIFVNDGSMDNSKTILEHYTNQYSNMKLINQTNLGVSEARNVGIKNSKGEFVCFFDADDIAKPTLYERLHDLITSNDVDVAVVDYSMVFPDGMKKKHRNSVNRLFIDNKVIIKEFFKGNLICTNPVDKIFRRNVIDGIWFPNGYAIGEDMYFVYQAIRRCNRLIINSFESLYLYCLRSDSAMKKKFSNEHIDSVKLAKMILNDFDITDINYKYAEANYIHEICKMLSLYLKSDAPKEYENVIASNRKELKAYRIFDAFQYMNTKHFFAFFLMRYFPKLYQSLYRILRIG